MKVALPAAGVVSAAAEAATAVHQAEAVDTAVAWEEVWEEEWLVASLAARSSFHTFVSLLKTGDRFTDITIATLPGRLARSEGSLPSSW